MKNNCKNGELHSNLKGDDIISIGNQGILHEKVDAKDITSNNEDLRREKLLCNIFDLEPQDQPVVISCGHFFCKSCLVNKFKSHARPRCPKCNKVELISHKTIVKLWHR